MPFGVTAAIAGGLTAAGIGATTASIVAAGIVGAGSGAIIGGASAALTGGNVGQGALYGGLGGAVTGGVGGALGGGATAAGGAAANAATAAGTNAATDAALDGVTNAGIEGIGSNIGANSAALGTSGAGQAAGSSFADLMGQSTANLGASNATNVGGFGLQGSDAALSGAGSGGADNIASLYAAADPSKIGMASGATNAASNAAAGAGSSSQSLLGQAGKWVLDHPDKAGQLGMSLLSGAQYLMPSKYSNPAQDARNNSSFSGELPKYTMQNTATPYSGDWYKYGQSPQTPMYNAMPQRVMAHGGVVRGYAQGGSVLPGAPPSAMPPMPPQGAMPQERNPLATHGGFDLGKAIGEKLKSSGALSKIDGNHGEALKIGAAIGQHLNSVSKSKTPIDGGMPPQGVVKGPGGGQDDLVMAKLSQGEYIIPAEVVSQLGDGSTEAGGKALDKMVSSVRKQKTGSGKFPPKAKNPLSYIKKKVL